jgi:N-acetylglucosaminyldiphosphoundecaprenol N-acetyl-beta-D-mannosaminyltransferase
MMDVLDLPYAVGSVESSAAAIVAMAQEKNSCKTVIFAPAYDAVLAKKDAVIKEATLSADLICADGMPIVWMQRVKGAKTAQRCSGPDVMAEVLRLSLDRGQRHFFYGSTPEVLRRIIGNLEVAYPGIKIAGHYAPPFRELTDAEDMMICDMISQSGADHVWVGLGCPKQQLWMHTHKGRIAVPVMLGVGAAFDFFAGTKPRAPVWMRRVGLEWLHRLCSEPKRLWKRYVFGNAAFVRYAIGDVICTVLRKST